MAFSIQVRKINRGIAKYHKDLIQLLNTAKQYQNSQNEVLLDSVTYEEITKISTKLFEKDCQLNNIYRKQPKLKNQADAVFKLKNDLKELSSLVENNSKRITRDLKRVTFILKEYKERCKEDFINFLRTLDADLRKTLQPLVPNQVLSEQIKYKPINESLATTLRGNLKAEHDNFNENENESGDRQVDMLNNHISLLVNTLEGVAKTLISITQHTDRKFYELTDVKELFTEPPSPLAAPLPDYFSFDVVALSEENREFNYLPNPVVIDETQKKQIIQKFEQMQSDSAPSFTPRKGERLRVKLERLLNRDAKEADILDLFREEGIPVSKREQLVYEIINSVGESTLMAKDVIEVYDVGLLRDINYLKQPSIFEVSGSNYSQELKHIQGKDLTDKFEGTLAEFGSLDSSIDEKMIRPNPSSKSRLDSRSINFNFSRKSSDGLIKFLPPVSIKAKGKELHNKRSVKDIRIRSITPSKQLSEDKKVQPRRSKTPAAKKKK